MAGSDGVAFWVNLTVAVAQDDSGVLVQRVVLNDSVGGFLHFVRRI